MRQTKSKKYDIACLKFLLVVGLLFSSFIAAGNQRAQSVEYFMGMKCSGYWVAHGAYGGKRCVPGQTYQRPPARAQNCEQIRAQMNAIARNAGWGDLGRLKSLEQQYYRCKAGQNRNGTAEAARHRALQAAARRKAEAQRRAADRRRSAIEAARREARRRSNPRCEKDGTKPVYDIDGDLTHFVVCGERALREAKEEKTKQRRAKVKHEAEAKKQRKAKADRLRKAKEHAKREAQASERKRQQEADRRKANQAKRRAEIARRAREERKRKAELARQRVAERKRKAEVKRQRAVSFKRQQRATYDDRISAALERQKRTQFNKNIARKAGKKHAGSPLIYQDRFSKPSRLEKWAKSKSDGSIFKTFKSNLNKNHNRGNIFPGDDYTRALNSPLPTQTSTPKKPVKLEWKRPNSPVPYPLGTATRPRPKAAPRPSTLPTTGPVIKFNQKNTSPKKDGWVMRKVKEALSKSGKKWGKQTEEWATKVGR